MSTKQIISISVIVLLVGGLSFYSGQSYGKSQVSSRGTGQFGTMGANNRPGGTRMMTGGGFVTGEVLSKDTNSVTVKMRDGSSKIVFYSASTEVQKSVTGSADDLVVGKNVTVTGKANSDGSITAQSIQLRTAPVNRPQD